MDEKEKALDAMLNDPVATSQALLAIISRKAVAAHLIGNNILVATNDGKVLMGVISDNKNQEDAVKAIDELFAKLKEDAEATGE